MPAPIEVVTYKADPVGNRPIPDAVIRITARQPVMQSAVWQHENLQRHQREAAKIHDALKRTLPGGTLNALVGLLLAEIGGNLLRVPAGLE